MSSSAFVTVQLFVTGVVLAGLGLAFLYIGVRRGRIALLLLRTPSADVGSIGDGKAKVRGEIVRPAGGNVEAPFTGTETAVVDCAVEYFEDRFGTTSRWVEETSVAMTAPFYLSDGTGEVLVDFDGADETAEAGREPDGGRRATVTDDLRCVLGEDDAVRPGDEPPEHVASFVAEHTDLGDRGGSPLAVGDGGPAHGERRYVESRVDVGEEIFVLGEYDSDAGLMTVPEDAPALLSDAPQRKILGWRSFVGGSFLLLGGVFSLLGVLALVAGVLTVAV